MSTPRSDADPVPFRILSLDGGGIKGTFSAAFLAGLEEATGKRIVDHFDLIAGTSTGGIIAIGLALGIPAADILHFYEREGPAIFPSTGVIKRTGLGLRQLFRSKHSPAALRSALESVFGSRRIGDAKTRLVVVSYDAVRGDVHVIKTAHHPKFKRDYKESAVDAALATSAAPTFLPSFIASSGVPFIDGGIWANCPATVAILEAVAVLGKRLDEIEVLSVGTTDEPYHVPVGKRAGGLLPWNKGIVDLLMQAQSRGAVAQANILTDHRMLRVDEIVRPGRFSLDDSRWIQELRALGVQKARHCEPEISERFLRQPITAFTPLYLV
jgi:uncharacterized protein